VTNCEILSAVMIELARAEKKFPGWPDDYVHGAAIVAEEAGELVQASLDYYYGRGQRAKCLTEAIQTAAMGIRYAINLAKEERKP